MFKSQGKTLIELLCALAILGIVTGASVQGFTIIQSSQVSSAANQLISATQFTRSEAISKGIPVYFCLTKDGVKCTSEWSTKGLIYQNEDNDKKYSEEDRLIRLIEFGESIKIKWRAFQNKSYLEMTPKGMTYYQNGTYTICHINNNLRIARSLVMNVAGRPYFGRDKNGNGIREYSNGEDISCG